MALVVAGVVIMCVTDKTAAPAKRCFRFESGLCGGRRLASLWRLREHLRICWATGGIGA